MQQKILSLALFLIAFQSLHAEELIVPPLLEGTNLELNMVNGQLALPWGKSKTMGFNGDYLGPTIRVSDGDYIEINVKNQLNEDSTVHWHGLHVPAEFDGGPHQVIKKGQSWNPRLTIDQAAATLWYHPHLLGKTAEHMYNGLAGLFIIEDSYSKSLNIPNEYGINDFPLIIQDREINKNGSFAYSPNINDIMHGYIGNQVLTNGSINPLLKVPAGTYRFRLLNGSNSSIFRIRFADNRNFTVIASDGGFLPKTVVTNNLTFSQGERFEILADFAKNEKITLITEIYGGRNHTSLTIQTDNRSGTFIAHPKRLKYSPVQVDDPDKIDRTLVMATRRMNSFTINGRSMDMDVINFNVNRNSKEVWEIKNGGGGLMRMMQFPHSIHVHDGQFTILSINNQKPDPLYSGPKDTVLLWPGDSVKIALNFQDYTGIYIYHCHFLEHEDAGMMGQFLVE